MCEHLFETTPRYVSWREQAAKALCKSAERISAAGG
jgi:hypothetical protein